jgi:DNA-binding Lrp family transcriptional regulator
VRDLLEAMPDARARSTSEPGASMPRGSEACENIGQPSPSRLDYLDQRIVAALQANARATWRQIAAVVGTSESTVKRRAERLVHSGTIRITVFTETVSPGFPVLVQCTCKIGGAPAVARRLAERDDVRFVALVTGPFDVVAEMIVPSNRRLAEIILQELPAIPGITGTTTETVLRTFKTSYDWSRDLLGDKGADLDLAPNRCNGTAGPVVLDEISLTILQALREDGRCSFADLATRCGITESTARYRVDNLFTKAGVRAVTLVDPSLLGYDAELVVWLRVELARLEEVAAALAARREVRYISTTSGYSDLVCEVFLRSQSDVYEFTTRVLGKLPGIQHVNMASELVTLKRAYLRLDRP